MRRRSPGIGTSIDSFIPWSERLRMKLEECDEAFIVCGESSVSYLKGVTLTPVACSLCTKEVFASPSSLRIKARHEKAAYLCVDCFLSVPSERPNEIIDYGEDDEDEV